MKHLSFVVKCPSTIITVYVGENNTSEEHELTKVQGNIVRFDTPFFFSATRR